MSDVPSSIFDYHRPLDVTVHDLIYGEPVYRRSLEPREWEKNWDPSYPQIQEMRELSYSIPRASTIDYRDRIWSAGYSDYTPVHTNIYGSSAARRRRF